MAEEVLGESNGMTVSLIPEKVRSDYKKWLDELHTNKSANTIITNKNDLALLQELAFGPDDSVGFLKKHLGEVVRPNPAFPLDSPKQSDEYQKYRTNYKGLLESIEAAASMLASTKSPGKQANHAFTKALLKKWVTLEKEHGLYPPISLDRKTEKRKKLAQRCVELQEIRRG